MKIKNKWVGRTYAPDDSRITVWSSEHAQHVVIGSIKSGGLEGRPSFVYEGKIMATIWIDIDELIELHKTIGQFIEEALEPDGNDEH